jgi:hypothetical protein
MNRFLKVVRVIANPFLALDHKARPCGAFPQEPSAVGTHSGYVGARIDRDKTVVHRSKHPGDIREPLQDTVYSFSSDPQEVPTTPYYAHAIRSGALFPADKQCADWAKVAFVEPGAALKAAEAAAEANFESLYGEGSLAFVRGAPAPVEPEAPAAPETQASAASSEEAPNETSQPAAKRGNQGAKS